MKLEKLPQMRVLVTDYCDSKCIYCRPSGEGNLECKHLHMKYETACSAAKLYRAAGGSNIKISGGDPVFWGYLGEYVTFLKREAGFEHVELITRSPRFKSVFKTFDSIPDVINFSLDTIDQEKYKILTRKNDYAEYIDMVKYFANNCYCKINAVLYDSSIEEIYEMINFCRENGVKELKLLDYIDDIHGYKDEKQGSQSILFKVLQERLSSEAVASRIAFQGGLGHPMNVFEFSDGFNLIFKDSSQGAWYSKICQNCKNYPCHDALMALRVTPSDSFQLCLLNSKMHWKFNNENMAQKFKSIVNIYKEAYFIGSDENENNSLNTSEN